MKTPELFDTATVRKKKVFVHGAHNLNGKIEWYTPSQYVESARKVMGCINVDPCSSDVAQKVIRAAAYWVKENRGIKIIEWMKKESRSIASEGKRLLVFDIDGFITWAAKTFRSER